MFFLVLTKVVFYAIVCGLKSLVLAVEDGDPIKEMAMGYYVFFHGFGEDSCIFELDSLLFFLRGDHDHSEEIQVLVITNMPPQWAWEELDHLLGADKGDLVFAPTRMQHDERDWHDAVEQACRFLGVTLPNRYFPSCVERKLFQSAYVADVQKFPRDLFSS